MEQKVRWGIAGLGNIAHKFAEDLKLVPDAELTAVGSRNIDKAAAFAREHRVEAYYGSYLELFKSPEVDVIYIATPHTSHAQLSIQCMDQGKHVLCEKPMGTNRAEVEKMIHVALRNNVFLMEALWSRFNPSIDQVYERINKGDIGKVSYLRADFAFYSLDRSTEGRLLNPALAGGSLLDIGIYPVFLAYLVLGMPQKILATSNFFTTGVEIQTGIVLSYPNAMAVLYSGLNSRSEMKAEISGTNGSFTLLPRWHETQGYTLEKSGETEHFEMPTPGKGYSYEIEEVNSCIRSGKIQSEKWSHGNSVDLHWILDEIRSVAGVKFPFES